MSIHSTAVISSKARIDPSVEIGPYVVIDGEVTIGPNCRIFPHVHITGYTTIGENNEFTPVSSSAIRRRIWRLSRAQLCADRG